VQGAITTFATSPVPAAPAPEQRSEDPSIVITSEYAPAQP
jgi:hypothetical protein